MIEIKEVLERQKQDIKKLTYKQGKADGIADFLMLACEEFNDDWGGEAIYAPFVRQKLIEIAEMLKKEI